jgi:tetratricopeptide (TPR) repeat protein
VPEVARLKRVAVYPFEGYNAGVYRAEIEALLVSTTYQDKRYFSVVESARLDNVIREQRLGPMFDESTAAKVGQLVGAQGIFMGSITNDRVSDSHYNVTVKECSYSDKDGKCQKWHDKNVPCTRRVANVAFTIRLVDVQTRIQSYNKDVSGQAVSEQCRGSGGATEDKDSLRRRARQVAYEEIRKDIAPYVTNLNIELMSSTDGIESRSAREDLESGLEWAKEDRLDRACELWQKARSQARQSVAIIYNIGVCAEASGDLQSAFELYQTADRLLMKPDPVINRALTRMQQHLGMGPD